MTDLEWYVLITLAVAALAWSAWFLVPMALLTLTLVFD